MGGVPGTTGRGPASPGAATIDLMSALSSARAPELPDGQASGRVPLTERPVPFRGLRRALASVAGRWARGVAGPPPERSLDRTEERAAQLEVLRAAAARMSRESSVETIGQAIVEETGRIIDYHNARVYLLEPPDDVVPIAFAGRVGEYDKVDLEVLRTKIGVGFTGWVAGTGQPLLVNDANADPRGSTIPGTDDVDESMLVVPMRYDDRVLGVITLSKLGLDQFDAEDLRLLMILADQSATAMETSRLLARSEALARELRQIVDMGSALSQSLETRAVADLIARHLAVAVGADECTISYWDRDEDRLLTRGLYPRTGADPYEESYALAAYPETRRVLLERVAATVDIDDPLADPAEVALLQLQNRRSLVMLPLVAKGQSIGLVELLSSDPASLDGARLEFARTMANEAAMALENARLYEEARRLADRDPLTGFANHRALYERLGEEIIRAGRSRQPVSVLMLDVDDFKLVNDTLGHLFGDHVLVWTADRIRSTLRASDVPSRYGGDEFAVILPHTDAPAAAAAAARITAAFRDSPYTSDERGPVPIGISIGAATHPADGRTAQDLISAADADLYRAKRAGRAAGPGTGRAARRTSRAARGATASGVSPAAPATAAVPAGAAVPAASVGEAVTPAAPTGRKVPGTRRRSY